MKRYIGLGLIAVMMLVGSVVHAAVGTVTVDHSRMGPDDAILTVTFSITASATDGTIPDTVLSSDYNTSLFNSIVNGGYCLYSVECVGALAAGTEVQDDSDVYLYMQSGGVAKAVDLLGGAGVDKLDDDVNYTVWPLTSMNVEILRPVTDTLTLTVTQATAKVNSAVCYITATFVKVRR